MSVYGARTIKKRGRRTKAEVKELRNALFEIVVENMPVTVRGAFYLASSAGLVPKDDAKGYRPVQRELLKMRRASANPRPVRRCGMIRKRRSTPKKKKRPPRTGVVLRRNECPAFVTLCSKL